MPQLWKNLSGQQDVSRVTLELTLPHSMGPLEISTCGLRGRVLDLTPSIEVGVVLLTGCSLRSFVYTGEEQNSERSLRNVQTYSYAQACVHTVGIHTYNTQLGMGSCRMDGWEALEYFTLPSYLGRCPQCSIHSSCLSPCLLPVLPNQHVCMWSSQSYVVSACLVSSDRQTGRGVAQC